ncbi:MAG: DciA family protein [Sediminibacterium sp.]|nr:DciA family protein [Sediminibacterium sp.]
MKVKYFEPKPYHASISTVQSALQKWLKYNPALREEFYNIEVQEILKSILPQKLSKYIQQIEWKKSNLYLQSQFGVVKQEIQSNKKTIIREFNLKVPTHLKIKDIFWVG